MVEKITIEQKQKQKINTNAWQKVSYRKKSKITISNEKSEQKVKKNVRVSKNTQVGKQLQSQIQIQVQTQVPAREDTQTVGKAEHRHQLSKSRRRRANLQEIRQIKRAHRHLLTSGGIDRPRAAGVATLQKRKLDCQTNSCCSLIEEKQKQKQKRKQKQLPHQLQQQQQGKRQQQQNHHQQLQQRQEQKKQHQSKKKLENLNKNAHSGGGSIGVKETGTTRRLQNNNANRKQQPQQHQQQKKGKQKKQKQEGETDNCTIYADSLISSRWCSIEEQLDLLEKLLHLHCDEEEDNAWSSGVDRTINWDRAVGYDCDDDDDDDDDNDNYSAYDDNSQGDLESDWSDMSQQSDMEDLAEVRSTTSGAGTSATSTSTSPLVPASLKRRGHQHHPRFSGQRRPNVPNVKEILAALYRGDSKGVLSNLRSATQSQLDGSDVDTLSTLDDSQTMEEPEEDVDQVKSSLNLPLTDSVTNSLGSNSPTPTDDSSMVDEGVVSAQTPTSSSTATATTTSATDPDSAVAKVAGKTKTKSRREKTDRAEKKSKKSRKDKHKRASACLEGDASHAAGSGLADALNAMDEGIAVDEDDTQSAEWAKLRCTSEAAEVVAEREARRNKGRCADYPGLAFGRSIFSSDTMMKFNIIRNELHNIMKTQLKRVIRTSKA